MSDKKHKDIGLVEDILIEECAELIKAICKAKRFGWRHHHPDKPSPTSNLQDIKDEIKDVEESIARFKIKFYII